MIVYFYKYTIKKNKYNIKKIILLKKQIKN